MEATTSKGKDLLDDIISDIKLQTSDLPTEASLKAKTAQNIMYEQIMAAMGKTKTINLNPSVIDVPVIREAEKAEPRKLYVPKRFVMPDEEISSFIKKTAKVSGSEIEASLGTYTENGFSPGIKSHTEFSNLKNKLMLQSDRFEVTEYEDVMESMNLVTDENHRKRLRKKYDIATPNDVSYEIKTRDRNTLEIRDVGVRITRSVEEHVDIDKYEFIPTSRRIRRRISFVPISKKDEFSGLSIDLTIVQETKLTTTNAKQVSGATEKRFEVEIEIIKRTTNTFTRISKAIEYVYFASISNLAPKYDSRLFFDIEERSHLVALNNELWNSVMSGNKKSQYAWKGNNPHHLYDGSFWNKPKNIPLDQLRPFKHEGKYIFPYGDSFVTLKTNGKRMFLFITEEKSWLLMPPYTVSIFGTGSKEYAGTYIDGEFELEVDEEGNYISYSFHIFDILFYKGKNVMEKSFVERRELFSEIKNVISPYAIALSVKNFRHASKATDDTPAKDIYDIVTEVLVEYNSIKSENEDKLDGLIFQYAGRYMNDFTYKWKPADEMTLDFYFRVATEQDVGDVNYPEITVDNYQRTFFLMVKSSGSRFVVFKPHNSGTFNGTVTFEEGDDYVRWMNTVVECKWDFKNTTFIPQITRDDRKNPNNEETARAVWRDIIRPVSAETISGNDFVVMRKIHNSIKDDLLKKYLKKGDIILDIGSGRGGDISKWTNIGLERVYCIEPDVSREKEFMSRLSEEQLKKGDAVPDVNLLHIGAQETDKIKLNMQYDNLNAIVSFFSLTFFGQNSDMYEGLLNTINLLPEGGQLICAVMDGTRTFNLLESADKSFDLSSQLDILNKRLEIISSSFKEDLAKNNVILDKYTAEFRELSKLTKKQYIEKNQENMEALLVAIEKLERQRDKGKMVDNEITAYMEEYGELEKNNGNRRDDYIKQLSEKINKLKANIVMTDIKQQQEIAEVNEAIKAVKNTISVGGNNNVEEYSDMLKYKEGPLTIEQKSYFDVESPIGNEILIDMNDSTAMVRGQTEWLFMSDIFLGRLNEMGFVMTYDKFLDGKNVKKTSVEGMSGNILRALPRASFEFSSLNRVMILKRENTIKHIFNSPKFIGDIARFENKIERNLVVKSVESQYGSFIHAVLEGSDPDYQELTSSQEKFDYVKKLRLSIASEYLTEEIFFSLHDGELARRMAYPLLKVSTTEESSMKLAYLNFQKKIADTREDVAETSMLEILGMLYGVGIYVISAGKGGIDTVFYTGGENYCDRVLAHENSVVVVKGEDAYYLAGRENNGEYEFIFNSDDGFIQKLKGRLCGDFETPIISIQPKKKVVKGSKKKKNVKKI